MAIRPAAPASRELEVEREQHEPSRPSGRRPLVVALIGLPGAGKSTVARALEQQLGLRRVCRDAIRHALFPHCA